MAKKTAKHGLPATLYVRIEEDGPDSFPVSNENLEDVDDDGSVIGVYSLVATARKTAALADLKYEE